MKVPDDGLNEVKQVVQRCKYIKSVVFDCKHHLHFNINYKRSNHKKLIYPPFDSIMVYILLKHYAIHLKFPYP
jgi:hypothetical protein